MPVKVRKKQPTALTAWSYSRLSTYEMCPAKAKYQFIDKLPDPGNAAMERGSRVHAQAAGYVLGSVKKLPDELKSFKKEFEAARKIKLLDKLVEAQFAFDSNWEPLEDFFDAKTFLRVKIDLALKIRSGIPHIIDFKTGRQQVYHHEQTELYALGWFLTHPTINKLRTELWYVDLGELTKQDFKRSQVEDLKKRWGDRANKMLLDRKFLPRPGGVCSFCPYARSKKGPCRYG